MNLRIRDTARALKGFAAAKTAGVRGRMRRAVSAVVQYRPSDRGWTWIVATVAVALGAFLVIGPARDLATGKDFSLQTLLTLCWLATGSSMLAAGIGIFTRLPSFRKFVKVAFFCSLPLPAHFIYKTMAFAVRLRTEPSSSRETLETHISGGVQLSLFFLAVSGFLFFLLRFKHLKSLQCSGAAMAGRAGPVIVGGVGAALGSVVGYLFWLLCRWLGFSQGITLFSEGVYAVRVDYFVIVGAFLGAGVLVFRTMRRRTRQRGPTAQGPMTQGPTSPGPAAPMAPSQHP